MGVPGFLVSCALWCVTFSANLTTPTPPVPSYSYGITGEPSKVDTAFGNLGDGGPMYEIDARIDDGTSSSPSSQDTLWLANRTNPTPTTVSPQPTSKKPKPENVATLPTTYNVTSGVMEASEATPSQNETATEVPRRPGIQPTANSTSDTATGLSGSTLSGMMTSLPASQSSQTVAVVPPRTSPTMQSAEFTTPSQVFVTSQRTTTTKPDLTANQTSPSQAFETSQGTTTTKPDLIANQTSPSQAFETKVNSTQPIIRPTPSQTFETGGSTTTRRPASQPSTSNTTQPNSSISFHPSMFQSCFIAAIAIVFSSVF